VIIVWHVGKKGLCLVKRFGDILECAQGVTKNGLMHIKIFYYDMEGLKREKRMKGKCQFCGYETELIEHIEESIDESKEASCAAEVGGIKTIRVCKFCYALGENYVGCMHYPNMYGDYDAMMKQISVVGNTIFDEVRKARFGT